MTKLRSRGGRARPRALVLTIALATAALAAFGAVGYASPSGSAAGQQYGPQLNYPPVISGVPVVGDTLVVSNGVWTSGPEIRFAYQWQRCDANGAGCTAVTGATAQTYPLSRADVGRTLRGVVTATHSAGSSTATSAPSPVIRVTIPEGQIRLPGGGISIPATSVEAPARLIVDRVGFSPNPVRSRSSRITVRVRVRDTRGFFVRGALVFLRSTPLVTTTAPEQATQTNGTVRFTIRPRADFPLRRGHFVQFFVRARKSGDNVLAGISTRRLVQLRTAR